MRMTRSEVDNAAEPVPAPRVRLIAVGLAAVLLAAAVGTATASGATPAPRVAPVAARSAPLVPPSSFGPYKVGRTVIQITSRTGRSRTVDVWYPVSPRTTGRQSIYVGPSFSGLSYPNRSLDRVPVASGRPFPLVVYSHGSGGLRFIATFFTETLASHGFVVIAADHAGDTISDVFAGRPATYDRGPQVIASRAADVRMIVNGVLTRSKTRGDLLYGAVDPTRIGITGHSWGGLTAFATVSGATLPDGTKIPRDTRFKTIVTMDATTSLLSTDDLDRVTVPAMSIVGEGFQVGIPNLWHQTRATPFAEVHIKRAAHNVFTDICRYQQLAPRFTDAEPGVIAYINTVANDACAAPHLPAAEAQLLTNRYAIAFLLRHLAGDKRYASYLTSRRGTEFALTYPARVVLPPPDTTPLPPVID